MGRAEREEYKMDESEEELLVHYSLNRNKNIINGTLSNVFGNTYHSKLYTMLRSDIIQIL